MSEVADKMHGFDTGLSHSKKTASAARMAGR
jgi:hypothetical protein